MTTPTTSAQRLSVFAQASDPSSDAPDVLRIIAVGSLKVVNHHVIRMYQLGYAHPHEWSQPLPTPNANEVMRILTKRIMGL